MTKFNLLFPHTGGHMTIFFSLLIPNNCFLLVTYSPHTSKYRIFFWWADGSFEWKEMNGSQVHTLYIKKKLKWIYDINDYFWSQWGCWYAQSIISETRHKNLLHAPVLKKKTLGNLSKACFDMLKKKIRSDLFKLTHIQLIFNYNQGLWGICLFLETIQ